MSHYGDPKNHSEGHNVSFLKIDKFNLSLLVV